MQLHIKDDQYVTLRGNNLSLHEKKAKTAYASAKTKYKFKSSEPATLSILDDDNGISVNVSVAGKDYGAIYKGEKWHWSDGSSEEKNDDEQEGGTE